MDQPRRPRNRNNASSRGGRGGRGGRHHNPNPHPRPSPSTSVPTPAQVIPGAPVSIILKADQPTGRQVQGFVSEVLTRGPHPRGIKVRLVDGRVGRVQAMASEDAATAGSAGLEGLGRNGETAGGVGSSGGRLGGRREVDVRYDGYDYESSAAAREEPSLMDYVKPAKQKAGSRRPPRALEEEQEEPATVSRSQVEAGEREVVACPVCGGFEGDTEAVAHHVNSHFE